MNNKGSTLIEMLAVTLIIVLMLYFTLPKLFGGNQVSEINDALNNALDIEPSDVNPNMGTIGTIKTFGMQESAMMILRSAESYYQTAVLLDSNLDNVKCEDITDLSPDYGECIIKYDDNGKATISLKASETGKFKGYSCSGTRENLTCEKTQ